MEPRVCLRPTLPERDVRGGVRGRAGCLRKRQLLDLAPLQRDEVVALAQLPAVVGDVGWGDHIEVDAALVLAHLDLEAPAGRVSWALR